MIVGVFMANKNDDLVLEVENMPSEKQVKMKLEEVSEFLSKELSKTKKTTD